MSRGYYGVDFDGTLSIYKHGEFRLDHAGEPVSLMVERVKGWLAEGKRVVIVTARMSCDPRDRAMARKTVEDFCLKYIGQKLEVTNEKTFGMIRLYDDRAVRVEENTGKLLSPEQ